MRMLGRAAAAGAGLAAGPALAADEYGFVSLRNTDFIVLIGFLAFLGVLAYFRVPQLVSGLLDKRATGIRSELDEARRLREEAQTVLASYERKQREAAEQADRIVATAREEAQAAADQAKVDLKDSVARRIRGAEEQIESARDAAIRDVRDRAIDVATAAAAQVVRERMGEDKANALIDDSIGVVDAKLH